MVRRVGWNCHDIMKASTDCSMSALTPASVLRFGRMNGDANGRKMRVFETTAVVQERSDRRRAHSASIAPGRHSRYVSGDFMQRHQRQVAGLLPHYG